MRRDGEPTVAAERWTAWPVSWSPVVLGAMASVVAVVLFGLIGTAIGAHRSGVEGRITDWSAIGFGGLVYAVIASFFAFVAGAWIAVKGAGIRRAEPAVLHGAISWLVAVFALLVLAALGAGSLSGWYIGLAPSGIVPAGQPVDPAFAAATRNAAVAAAGALLIGLMGAVVGAWWASGEPMVAGRYRVRLEPYPDVRERSERTTRIS